MKKFNLIFIATLLCFSGMLYSGGGSGYSKFGVGDLISIPTSRTTGLGGKGISLLSKKYLNIENPASYAALRFVRFETGFSVDYKKISDNNNSDFITNSSFNSISIGLPVEREIGIGITFGFRPVSLNNYNNITNSVVDNADVTFEGEGGINKFFIGAGINTNLGLYIGGSIDFYTGRIENRTNIDYNSESTFNDSYFERSEVYSGSGITLGLITDDISNLLGLESVKNFKFAFTYENMGEIDVDSSLNISASLGPISEINGKTTKKFPSKINFGTNLEIGNFNIIADYFYQDWTDSDFNNINNGTFENLQRVSLGFEYDRKGSIYSDLSKQLILRGGISYDTGYYKLYNENIDQYSLHFGFSMPLGNLSSLDVGFMYGYRGSENSNLIQEHIYNVSLGLSLGELWFMRMEK